MQHKTGEHLPQCSPAMHTGRLFNDLSPLLVVLAQTQRYGGIFECAVNMTCTG